MLSFERSIHAAVSVAPMPRCSGCSSADLQIVLLAKYSAVESRFVLALQPGCTCPKTLAAGFASSSRQCFTTVSTAKALAISPCASPPIPSASTKRFSDVVLRKQSSLFVRTRPTSVTPPLEICTLSPIRWLNSHPSPSLPRPQPVSTLAHPPPRERP